MINLLKGSARRFLKKQAFNFSTNDLLYDRAFLASKIIDEISFWSSQEIPKNIRTKS